MDENWTETTLENVVALQRGHDLPQTRRVSGEVPVIGSGGIVGRHNVAVASGPGVVIGRATNLGRPIWIDEPYWPLNTSLYVIDFMGNDPRWVFHLFEVMDLSGYDSGSVQPMLNRNYIRSVPVSLPPLTVQRQIAAVLATLDDLIETNQRIIRAVIEVAVAFASSLPSQGLIELKDLYQVGLSGVWGNDSETDRASESVAVLRGRDLEDLAQGKGVSPPIRFLSPRQVEVRLPAVGEIWTAGSGSLGPTLPVVPTLSRLVGTDRVLYSNFVKRLVPVERTDWWGTAWVALYRTWRAGGFDNFKTGTAMPNLSAEALLRGVQVPGLEPGTRQVVNNLVALAFSPELHEEITSIRRTRDELLPLLMSGRVSPGEVDLGV